MNDIVKRYTKGEKQQINQEYTEKIRIKKSEKKLPLHLQDKIKISRRRHVEKLGIKKIIESEQFIRIKYIRYANDFLIGVKGSRELANKIAILVNSFLKSNLHLQLNMDKTKITDTYNDKVSFLGMLIYNKHVRDLPYINSREVENTKRVKNRNKVSKLVKTNKILKKTRERFIKLLDMEIRKVQKGQENFIKKIMSPFHNKSYRSKIRDITNVINSVELESTVNIKNDLLTNVEEVKPKKVPVNKLEIMNRIHKMLLKLGAITVDHAHGKRMGHKKIKEFLTNYNLTYCPETIELDEIQKKKLVSKDGNNVKRDSSIEN